MVGDVMAGVVGRYARGKVAAVRNLQAPSRLCRESNTALKNCLNLKTNTVTFIC